MRFFEYRWLSWILAMAALVLMLPALSTGLLSDDLIQRLAQLRPGELPARAVDTGFVPNNPGTLGTVLFNLFGYLQADGAAARARDYGVMPWWTVETWRAALLRPCTALTHWLDYRLFPNTPVLMHAHNIVWYAAAVFLATSLYRKIAAFASEGTPSRRGPVLGDSLEPAWALRAAGLAACLLLLDKNTYVPVMYVANRGFIIALAFGLLCLHAHIRWRTTQASAWMWLSALCLMLSLLADEGGVSTLAFLLGYALVLEPGGWWPRLGSLLPAVAVTLGWRTVYVAGGFGVRNFLLYIDPGYEPWLFLKQLAPRANGLLGGQLTGVPPELALGLSTKCQIILALSFAVFSLLCATVALPVLRRDRLARFWTLVMLLALVPAATVAPLSKNLGFVAVGSFGAVASFLVHFAGSGKRAAGTWPIQAVSWIVASWLVLAHVPGALAARVALALASPYIPVVAQRVSALEYAGEIGNRQLVVINEPSVIAAVVPFERAYSGQPLPRSIRILVPGSIRIAVKRTDASTLLLTASEGDLFDCPDLGPIHLAYGCKAANELLLGGRVWKAGERVTCKGFQAEVLDLSPRGMPRSVAFHFDGPLESEKKVWLYVNWRRLKHEAFVLPQIGETIEIAAVR